MAIHLLTFFFFLAFPFHGRSQTSNSTISELSTLLDLKNHWATDDTPFFSNWTTSANHCTWFGVVCTSGAVTGLHIINASVTAPIPASLCNLKNLTHLELQWNFIPGSFPTVLYNCSFLQYLDLSQNYFVGTIPDDVSKLSPQLQFLNLEANNFTGNIPPGIGNLPGLVTLHLNANLFNGSFPAEIGNLLNLEFLILSSNDFLPQSIPSTFGKLKKLRNLWMTGVNLIGEIPDEIGNASALEFIDLSENGLTGRIPGSLFLLQNLQILYLYDNGLSGSIPAKIEALNLNIVDLSNNSLTGTIPDDIGKLKNLTGLALKFNQLSGEVPASIATLPNLLDLNIFSNSLSGNLPPDIGRFSMLRELQFSENRFSGELPKYLCINGALKGLIAFDNNLTGGLPDSLRNCSTLEIVRAHDNRLSGEVPAGLWTLPKLTTLMLGNNMFSGSLPDRIGPQLSTLELMNNQFSGEIPNGISNWQVLTVFRISNNSLTGKIPQGFTALSSLSIALLDGNQLSGSLPSDIISWKSLSTLHLNNNHLSSNIPASFGRLHDLMDLDLSGNQISGQIPPEFGNLDMTSLNLSSNQLSGRIPGKFENGAFDRSFLNNPSLCSDVPSLSLASCHVRKSNKHSSKFVAAVSSIAAVAFLVGVVYTIFVCRSFRKRKGSLDPNWKLTSFQRLNFTERNVLSSLTDENLIGSGGSGRVYHVLVRDSGEKFAVKRIWDNMKLDGKLEKEFKAEVAILGMIRHSNIVKLYCCISSETSKLLVYEYMENQSLDRWLHKKREPYGSSRSIHHTVLDWPKRLHIAIGAAQGLCYMHHECSSPIIHRDVKSSNILLDSQFNPKIADFGLARMLIRHGEANTMSIVAGSVGYMAPEYYQTRRVSEKVDVYSFGVVLLELITGKEAQHGDEMSSLVDWAWRHIQGNRPIVDILDEDINKSLYMEEIHTVLKLGLICTSKYPSSRPSMKSVLQVLQQCSARSPQAKNAYKNERDIAPLLQNSKSVRSVASSHSGDFTSI